ncbi:hypothetical protein [Actinoallomurus sp. CA-150999]|uniref:hypothetical protein n=1 Tax=Actinoallomurus sp. CA-150999 TaxID=3239887 RepID=UPI003D90CD3C
MDSLPAQIRHRPAGPNRRAASPGGRQWPDLRRPPRPEWQPGSDTPTTATIAGSHGTLILPGPFNQPGDLILTPHGGPALTFTEPRTAHDARCITAGRPQSTIRPLDDSITTLRVMDEIRAQCGIVFPTES